MAYILATFWFSGLTVSFKDFSSAANQDRERERKKHILLIVGFQKHLYCGSMVAAYRNDLKRMGVCLQENLCDDML